MKLISLYKTSATPLQQIIIYWLAGISLLVLWYSYFIYLQPLAFPIDDAYLVIHNAQVLHLGHDPNYVGTPALAGATSLVHLALVALLCFKLKSLTALITIAWLAIMIYAFGLLRLAFLFSASIPQAIIFLISGLTIGYVSYQLLNGLETGLLLAAVIWTCILATRCTRSLSRIILFILYGTLPFIRPELSIFSALLFFYSIYQYWQQYCISYKEKIFALLFHGSITVLAALPWLTWTWCDMGTLWPNTLAAKTAFFASTHFPLVAKLQFSFAYLAGFIVSLGALSFLGMLTFACFTPIGRLGLIFTFIIFTFYLLQFPFAFRDYIHRYLYIVLPFLLYGVISIIQHPDKTLRLSANILLLLVLCQSLWNFPKHWHTYLEFRQYQLLQANYFFAWCIKHLHRQAIILVNDAGYMAYATHFRLIDVVGLKTPATIIYHQQITLPSLGNNRTQAIAEIIKHYHPQYFVTSDDKLVNTKQIKTFAVSLKLLYATTPYNYWIYAIQNSS